MPRPLIELLHEHGFTWSTHNAVFMTGPALGAPCVVVTLAKEDVGTYGYQYHPWEMAALEQRLLTTVRRHFRSDPVLAHYHREHGDVPARLTATSRHELSNAIHTALRKEADSNASILTYNALQQIPSKAYNTFMGAIHAALVAIAPENPLVGVTRRELGETVQRAAVETAEELQLGAAMTVANGRYREDDVPEHEIAAAKANAFAHTMLVVGCKMTDMNEWMHGWLAYVVTDVVKAPASEPEDAVAAKAPAAG